MKDWISIAVLVTSIGFGCLLGCVPSEQMPFKVGGTISGLWGTLELANGTQSLIVDSDGGFEFREGYINNVDYHVIINRQLLWQTCTLLNGSGRIPNGDAKNIQITCYDNEPSRQVSDTGMALCGVYALNFGANQYRQNFDCADTGAGMAVDGVNAYGDPVPAGQDAVYGRKDQYRFL